MTQEVSGRMIAVGVLLLFFLVFIASAISALGVWLLWNWIAVEQFGARPLGYWTVFGVLYALGLVGRWIWGRR